jgi:hypothetical protein
VLEKFVNGFAVYERNRKYRNRPRDSGNPVENELYRVNEIRPAVHLARIVPNRSAFRKRNDLHGQRLAAAIWLDGKAFNLPKSLHLL